MDFHSFSSSNFHSTAAENTIGTSSSSYFSSPTSTSSSPSYSSHFPGNDTTFARRVGRLIHVIITCVFAAVGSIIGAVTGGLIGLAAESGPLRGAGIGAISGAVFAIEAFHSSLALWHSNEPGIWSVLFVVDIVCSLLSGRLVREKVGPVMRSAVQSQVKNLLGMKSGNEQSFVNSSHNESESDIVKQMSTVDSPFMEAIDIFDTGGIKGLTKESLERLPMISITSQNNVDDNGERLCCVVCLQDFDVGEGVRCLPHCWHKFHLPCIDGWLIGHGSCPLCRRDL